MEIEGSWRKKQFISFYPIYDVPKTRRIGFQAEVEKSEQGILIGTGIIHILIIGSQRMRHLVISINTYMNV